MRTWRCPARLDSTYQESRTTIAKMIVRAPLEASTLEGTRWIPPPRILKEIRRMRQRREVGSRAKRETPVSASSRDESPRKCGHHHVPDQRSVNSDTWA